MTQQYAWAPWLRSTSGVAGSPPPDITVMPVAIGLYLPLVATGAYVPLAATASLRGITMQLSNGFSTSVPRGDTVPITFTVTAAGVPVNLTGYVIWFTGKLAPDDADVDAVFTLTTSGGVVITDAANGVCVATVPSSASSDFWTDTTVYCALQLKAAGGAVSTPIHGAITFTTQDDIQRGTT